MVFKGVSNNITLEDFKQLLDFSKITHAKAEGMKSKRTGKDLPFIKIKSDDPKQAEAHISWGLICQKTGIIFKVEEFRITPSIQQCFKCQGFGHKAQNCTKKQKCVVCGEAHSHKDCPNRNEKTPKFANCRGPHVANYKGCPTYKDQAFRQHVVQNQITYASIVKQTSPPPPPTTHLISQPNKLYPWKQMWSYKSFSHNCVPKLCLKNKYRQNPICQNRSQKQPKMFRAKYLRQRCV